METLTTVKLREDLRNIAIIAHVDHGKTTLVDKMLRQAGVFRNNEIMVERVMDSNDLEKERGITILAKNTSVHYKNFKINIVDTPGHADFSGEVERILKMVDGVLLLVDAFEGPMPQTKFVLKKSLELDLKPIVVINKIDRHDARANEVLDEVFDLFVELEANDDQLDFPVVYASAKAGVAKLNMEDEAKDLQPLFETILSKITPPPGDDDAPLQMLVNTMEYDQFLGRLAIGRIFRGKIKTGETVNLIHKDGTMKAGKVARLLGYEGLKKIEIKDARAGDILCVAGFDDVAIGETLADLNDPHPLPPLSIGEPTISMYFIVNNSPFAGLEGKYVTSRNLRERLFKELRSNVALKVEETDDTDAFKVSGRGELHLSILIETMRREGFELSVSRPEVILKMVGDEKFEPMEKMVIDVEEGYMGIVMEKMGQRKAELKNMVNSGTGHVRLEFEIPARCLFGYRTEFLTDTKGTGILNHHFHDYQPYKGEITGRIKGVLISMEQGETVAYAMNHVQERGVLFIDPQLPVYEGMIVGENSRNTDMVVNVVKKKHLTNIRSSSAEDAIVLTPPRKLSLEQAIEFIADDELVEVTPKSIRLRKRYLSENDRKRQTKK
ncbi:MAG: translational GTPase TypA [Nitrospirae bacterium]|nr:translational GTPase TypA [Nitrospirota bacterium]